MITIIELSFILFYYINDQPHPESITDHNLSKVFRAHLHVFIAGGLTEEGIWRVWQGRRNHQPDLHGDDPEEHGGGRHQGAVLVEIEIIIIFIRVLQL